jgi:hypothetical protein
LPPKTIRRITPSLLSCQGERRDYPADSALLASFFIPSKARDLYCLPEFFIRRQH